MDVSEIEEIQTENPQSRFRVTKMPILAPGTCILCKSSGGDERAFIDFGMQLDWFGAVYFCTECITEAAKLIGLEQNSDWARTEKNLRTEVSRVTDLCADARVKLDAAMVLVRDCTCSDSGIGSPPLEITEAELVEHGSDVRDSVSEPEFDGSESEEVSGGEPDPDESASIEGLDSIPADSGDDEFTASGKPRRSRKSTG